MLLDDETRKNVEISISYARSADAFKYLRCDPSTLKPSEIPRSPIIIGLPEELRHLIRVFTVQRDVEGIGEDINRSLRLVWPTLIPWLDFLHPKHRIRNARPSLIPLPDLCSVFRSIYALEDREAQKKRAASQHLCDLLFDLWLHFDTYNAGESTDVLSCLHILGDAVTEAIFVAGKDRRWEAEGGTQSKPGGNKALLRDWKRRWIDSPEYARISHIDKTPPFTRFLRHTKDMDLRRSQYNVLVQIRIGHIGLNAHLHKKKLVDSPNCPSCMARGDATRETLRHFLFECPSYRAERVVLTQALGRDARNLEAIFHERKGMYALLRYVGRTRRLQQIFGDVSNFRENDSGQ